MPAKSAAECSLLKGFAEHLPEGIFIFDATKPGMVYCNAALERLSGLSAATLLADFRAWLSRVHPDDQVAAAAIESAGGVLSCVDRGEDLQFWIELSALG